MSADGDFIVLNRNYDEKDTNQHDRSISPAALLLPSELMDAAYSDSINSGNTAVSKRKSDIDKDRSDVSDADYNIAMVPEPNGQVVNAPRTHISELDRDGNTNDIVIGSDGTVSVSNKMRKTSAVVSDSDIVQGSDNDDSGNLVILSDDSCDAEDLFSVDVSNPNTDRNGALAASNLLAQRKQDAVTAASFDAEASVEMRYQYAVQVQLATHVSNSATEGPVSSLQSALTQSPVPGEERIVRPRNIVKDWPVLGSEKELTENTSISKLKVAKPRKSLPAPQMSVPENVLRGKTLSFKTPNVTPRSTVSENAVSENTVSECIVLDPEEDSGDNTLPGTKQVSQTTMSALRALLKKQYQEK